VEYTDKNADDDRDAYEQGDEKAGTNAPTNTEIASTHSIGR
jgi:hypothetical protein